MRKHIVVVSGGHVEESVLIQILDKGVDIIIAVDGGLEYLYALHMKGVDLYSPDYIVGDFDSVDQNILDYYREHTHVSIRQYNPVKDASDTEIGVRLALELEAEQITILGATGTRIDHVWANIQVLTIPFHKGVSAKIIDAHNQIQIVPNNMVLSKSESFGKYFSVFSLGSSVTGVTIEGAKYPLREHQLLPEDSLSVSNQFAEEKVSISYKTGILVLVESKD